MIKQDGTVKHASREIRQAKRGLTDQGRATIDLLSTWEQHEFVDPVTLYKLADQAPLHFIAFSCLGTYRGKQELRPSLDETYFFRSSKVAPRAIELVRALEAAGVTVSVHAFLQDREPCRTWGWQVAQGDITAACELMREGGQSALPSNWHITLWSEVETMCGGEVPHASWTEWARKTHPLMIHQVTEHLRGFPEIEFVGGVKVAAARQVAAYALEGCLLEKMYPDAILLQSETPYERKARMYQLRRKQPLPIIHPFKM
jgi:hypothetical protein